MLHRCTKKCRSYTWNVTIHCDGRLEGEPLPAGSDPSPDPDACTRELEEALNADPELFLDSVIERVDPVDGDSCHKC